MLSHLPEFCQKVGEDEIDTLLGLLKNEYRKKCLSCAERDNSFSKKRFNALLKHRHHFVRDIEENEREPFIAGLSMGETN